MSTDRKRPLRVCLIDMNNGHENQAMRCLRSIVTTFAARVQSFNPGVGLELSHISPRDKGDVPPNDVDLYISSGGPGSPYEGDGDPWQVAYHSFLDNLVEENRLLAPGQARSMFAVCFSFELIVRHFKIAEMAPRASRKFGVMPVYTTGEGREHPLLEPFGDRLFAFEHRNWEAIGVDEARLRALDGRLLARESREGRDDKGTAILGVAIGGAIETVQFHPEADRAGVVTWVSKPDQAAAFRAAYGDLTYERMLKTLDDPNRLARTFAMMIPGWMGRKFNEMAPRHGWAPVGPPQIDMSVFGAQSARDLVQQSA